MWFQPGPHHMPPCGHMWKIRSGPDRNLETSWAISARVEIKCWKNWNYFNAALKLKGKFINREDLARSLIKWIKVEGEDKNNIFSILKPDCRSMLRQNLDGLSFTCAIVKRCIVSHAAPAEPCYYSVPRYHPFISEGSDFRNTCVPAET